MNEQGVHRSENPAFNVKLCGLGVMNSCQASIAVADKAESCMPCVVSRPLGDA
jgi:hypothetical protein